MLSNPIFTEFNKPVNYLELQHSHIEEAVATVIQEIKSGLITIYTIPDSERTFENTMLILDFLTDNLEFILSVSNLMAFTHSDATIRQVSIDKISELEKFATDISLDQNLYNAVKNYSQSQNGLNLTGYKEKYVKETVKEFERNGFGLSKEKRDELKIIRDQLSDLSILFETNIAEYKDELIVTSEEMQGLPEDYKENHKFGNNQYKIDLSYPSYRPFMKYSVSDKARKELYCKFLNRASDSNLPVLKELLIYRKKMAELLGFTTYSEYNLENKMAKKSETVWHFEEELRKNVTIKAKKDYQELLDIKRKYAGDDSIQVIQPWENSFFDNLLMKEKYEIDDEVVKEYFTLDNVINGIFDISQHLFDVTFHETTNLPVWHQEIRAFEVLQKGELIGRFYLDLFPRDNKYNHAAKFPIRSGRMTHQGYQKPVACLVCNFPPPSQEKPSLLPHSEVETFFHEFGHLLHHVLTNAELSSMAGTSVSRDFVETPSQLFENWAWNYEALTLFAKHYQTGEILPKELHSKMVAAKNVGSGVQTLQQIFYGLLDMTYHDSYNPEGQITTTDVVRKLQNEVTPYPYLENTHFEAGFGHLCGYAAGYYSYLWAKVYSEDIFSVFESTGVMNQQTGIRYRDTILSKGSTKDEMEILKEFLGREPSQEAFLKSLGL